jgi:uncharacterized phage-associated protein
LALTNGKPLIDESVEAWQFGPVVPSIYHQFKIYRNNPIKELATVFRPKQFVFVTPKITDLGLRPLLEKIWEIYGKLNGVQLSKLTHEPNSPWFEVWENKGGKNRKHIDIPDDLIKEYFCKKRRQGH